MIANRISLTRLYSLLGNCSAPPIDLAPVLTRIIRDSFNPMPPGIVTIRPRHIDVGGVPMLPGRVILTRPRRCVANSAARTGRWGTLAVSL
jgi:hypothetical protein